MVQRQALSRPITAPVNASEDLDYITASRQFEQQLLSDPPEHFDSLVEKLVTVDPFAAHALAQFFVLKDTRSVLSTAEMFNSFHTNGTHDASDDELPTLEASFEPDGF